MRAPRKCPLCGLPPDQWRVYRGADMRLWLRFAMHVFMAHTTDIDLGYCPCGYEVRDPGRKWSDDLTEHLRQFQTAAELCEHLILGAISSVGRGT